MGLGQYPRRSRILRSAGGAGHRATHAGDLGGEHHQCAELRGQHGGHPTDPQHRTGQSADRTPSTPSWRVCRCRPRQPSSRRWDGSAPTSPPPRPSSARPSRTARSTPKCRYRWFWAPNRWSGPRSTADRTPNCWLTPVRPAWSPPATKWAPAASGRPPGRGQLLQRRHLLPLRDLQTPPSTSATARKAVVPVNIVTDNDEYPDSVENFGISSPGARTGSSASAPAPPVRDRCPSRPPRCPVNSATAS